MTEKRNHYVSKFLLRRFAIDPSTENPLIWRQEKADGKLIRSNVNNEAAITHYNRLNTVRGVPPTFVENILAVIEGQAAEYTSRLANGQQLTDPERLRLALFIWLQHQRTPQGREWQVYMQEQAAKLCAMKDLCDADKIQQFFKGRGQFKTAEEIEAWRLQTLQDLDDGSLVIKAPHDREVLGMFLMADQGSRLLAAEMSWLGLRAPGTDRFILSDHPITFYDPFAGPSDPVAWLSSATVQVTLPLDPSLCLVLTPGADTYREIPVDAPTVQEINLRTYAWGHWCIYGSSEAVVQHVHSQARHQRDRVSAFAPRPPTLYLAERYEGQEYPFQVTLNRPPARGTRGRRRA